MELRDRIRMLINHINVSVPEFALLMGFKTPQAVYQLLNGKTKTLSFSAEHKILSKIPNLNKDWLQNGNGDMFNNTSNRSISTVENGGIATQGDSSPIYKDVKIDIEEELDANNDMPSNNEDSIKRIKKLQKLLVEAEIEVARLKGKTEEQSKIIKMLIENK